MRFILLLCALLLPSAAQAEWLEASSPHFVVYANDTERDIRLFSEQLERFHEAMELVTGFAGDLPSSSNRVTVFVVKNPREIQRLAGSRDIYGFYIPRAGGSVAFVPRVEVKTGQPDFSMIALLHEYAHHFLISNSGFSGPRWFGEGGAEFFASAQFTKAGGVSVGMPANHRGGELAWARNVKAAELVDPDLYATRSRGNTDDAFYGKSWALYHYLTFEPERGGQLRAYLSAMERGLSSRAAAEQVFGDLETLETELERYLDQRKMLAFQLKPEQFKTPEVTVRRISAGAAEMMPVRIRSRRGVTREQAIEILADARAVAARYPDDPAVLAALAEAEFDAGHDAEAIAAADSAIARNPNEVNAYVQKGYAMFRQADDADNRAAAYRKAAAPFIALNKIENDHPLPLIYFYYSFSAAGVEPTETAVAGLERAAELAPFDLGLRLTLARQQALDGRLDEARANLAPVAYSPHGGPLAEKTRELMLQLDGSLDQEQVAALFAGTQEGEAEEGGDEGAGAAPGG